MKRICYYLTTFLVVALITTNAAAQMPGEFSAQTDNSDCRAALQYLNKIRAMPNAYSTKLGVDLSGVEAREPLVWNEILAYVAQNKATDMATRGYFSHVDPEGNGINIKLHEAGYELRPDWFEEPSTGYFESLGRGYRTLTDAINGLIIDENVPSLGHRKHLLGIGDFRRNCFDAAIGHARSANGIDYYCVIIAKHDF